MFIKTVNSSQGVWKQPLQHGWLPTLFHQWVSGWVKSGGGGERRREARQWPHATIQGRAWARRAAAWSGRQGLPRPSGPFAGLKTDAMTLHRSAGWFVISYFSNSKPSLGRGRGGEEKKEKADVNVAARTTIPGHPSPSDWATTVRHTSSARFLVVSRVWQAVRRQGLGFSCVTAPNCTPSHLSVSVPLPLFLYLHSSPSSFQMPSSLFSPLHWYPCPCYILLVWLCIDSHIVFCIPFRHHTFFSMFFFLEEKLY